MKTPKLDSTDRKILEILQANSNITNAQLAKEIGLSPAPTRGRRKIARPRCGWGYPSFAARPSAFQSASTRRAAARRRS